MLLDEKVLPLSEIGAILPGRPSHSTLWRWCIVGYHGVKLEYLPVGRRYVTSVEAVERFSRKVAAARAERERRGVDGSSSGSELSRGAARAEAELEKAGF